MWQFCDQIWCLFRKRPWGTGGDSLIPFSLSSAPIQHPVATTNCENSGNKSCPIFALCGWGCFHTAGCCELGDAWFFGGFFIIFLIKMLSHFHLPPFNLDLLFLSFYLNFSMESGSNGEIIQGSIGMQVTTRKTCTHEQSLSPQYSGTSG